jgi:hypothetical protein
MGNRGVVIIQGQGVGMYVHHNGGHDTIKPLLDLAREYGIRGDDYGIARLAQMMGNFLGGTLSMGIDVIDNLDQANGDNGTYIVDEKFNIINRLYFDGREQDEFNYNDIKAHMKTLNDPFFLRGLKDEAPCSLRINDGQR